MSRKIPIARPPASVRDQRPRLAPEASRSNNRVEELDAQNEWLAHLAAGRIQVR